MEQLGLYERAKLAQQRVQEARQRYANRNLAPPASAAESFKDYRKRTEDTQGDAALTEMQNRIPNVTPLTRLGMGHVRKTRAFSPTIVDYLGMYIPQHGQDPSIGTTRAASVEDALLQNKSAGPTGRKKWSQVHERDLMLSPSYWNSNKERQVDLDLQEQMNVAVHEYNHAGFDVLQQKGVDPYPRVLVEKLSPYKRTKDGWDKNRWQGRRRAGEIFTRLVDLQYRKGKYKKHTEDELKRHLATMGIEADGEDKAFYKMLIKNAPKWAEFSNKWAKKVLSDKYDTVRDMKAE